MPIFTLRLKSMPSTNSRKPWTKCCRDCSPSVTMSRPASSCALSQSSVASRFACSSSSPAARQAGQSLRGSASHAGLGRLRGMVVLSMGSAFRAYYFHNVANKRRLIFRRLSFIMRHVVGRNSDMVFCSSLGALASFLVAILDPRILNKAGPDWMWMGGRGDVVPNLYFKPNGSFRRYGRAALLVPFVAGSAPNPLKLHPLMLRTRAGSPAAPPAL